MNSPSAEQQSILDGHRQPGGVRQLWQERLKNDALGLAWLGQAGFAFRYGTSRWLIDPYLSDFLSEEYRGTEFPHVRMMPAPMAANELRQLDWVLCSHRHPDHMDSGSLPVLARNNPQCRFVVPRAELDAALKAGVPAERMIAVNAGNTISLASDIQLSVIASAHETLETDAAGNHRYLGFVFHTPRCNIYHSGDCVPYQGLVEELIKHHIDVALLPVNGRDAFRLCHGFVGNMTSREALELCRAAGIPLMVAHHYGMFAFNTAAPDELEWLAKQSPALPHCCLTDPGEYLVFEERLPSKRK